MKAELDLSNYVTKADLKKRNRYIYQYFAKKSDLAGLKSEIDKLDIGKLETTPVNLNKLSDVVKTEDVKKTLYEELVKNVNAMQANDCWQFS